MIGDLKFSFAKAHEIIWKLGHWKYLFVPLALSVVLAVVLAGVCFGLAAALSGWVHGMLAERFAGYPGWLKHLLLAVFFLASIGPCYVAFRSLVLVCYGPWLDKLSTVAETLINGQASQLDTSLMESLKRPLLMAFWTILAAIGAMLGGIALGAIPLIGVLISGVAVTAINLFLSAVGYIDPYLERTGHTPRASFALMRRNKMGVLAFGIIGALFTLVPLVGWFVGPTYCVVAGVVYGILLTNAEQGVVKPTAPPSPPAVGTSG